MPIFISQGAESIIIKQEDSVIKRRLSKDYRIPELDSKIIKQRTKREARIMKKLNTLGIPSPKLVSVSPTEIIMEYLEGKTVKSKLEEADSKNDEETKKIFNKLGEIVLAMHKNDIIHGDLTTSNFIYSEKDETILVIDFGLSYISNKTEDKAVDLYVFERAINCAHSMDYLEYFYEVYTDKEVLKRLESVRKRGRKVSQ